MTYDAYDMPTKDTLSVGLIVIGVMVIVIIILVIVVFIWKVKTRVQRV